MTVVASQNTRDFVRRALEGKYVWGHIDVARSPRSLCASYRLVVYPPGTNSTERRRVTAYRDWPLGGALLAMVVLVATNVLVSEPLAIAAAVVVYAAGFIIFGRLSRTVRARSRRVDASFLVQFDGTISAGSPALLAASMRSLHELELARRTGRTNPAQFEARWADIYNSLDPAEIAKPTDR